MDFTVPRTYYPEWWNINTHRCNHINRPPFNQELYGYGRCFTADWARIGSVSINNISDNVQIDSQMSTKLVGKLQYYSKPIPLLPVHYSSSTSETEKSSLNSKQQHQGGGGGEEEEGVGDEEEDVTKGKSKQPIDASTVRDYGYEYLLNDYILGEQASAAFLCGKLQGLLRANVFKFIQTNQSINETNTTTTNNNNNNSVPDVNKYHCVSQIIENLFKLSEKGLNECDTIDSQNKLIETIQNLIVSCTESTDSFPGTHNSTATSKLKQPSTKRRRLTNNLSKSIKSSTTDIMNEGVENGAQEKPKQLLPCTIGKLLYPVNSSLSSAEPSSSSSSTALCKSPTTDYNRLLASFDPLVIRLASRIVNPNYLGNGLLCNVSKHHYYPSSSCTNHSDILLWYSLQTKSLCLGKISNLLKTNVHESNRFTTLPIPLTKLSSRLFCEFDACFNETNEKINAVGRFLPTSSSSSDNKKNVVCMQIKLNKSNLSHSRIKYMQTVRLSSRNYITSVCMSRWIPGEWCIAGNYLDESNDRKASIWLYNSEDTRLPIWSGQINLGNYMETMTKENALCLDSAVPLSSTTTSSSSSSSSKQDLVQSDIQSYCTYTSRKQLLRQYYPNYYWVRVGFGSYPGELYLTTTRRILIFDTRTTSSSAYQLFNTTERSSLFNSNDHITYCPPKWIGDVYVLAGCYYSMILLDKRMPNRTVLHWSHNLAKPVAYLNWTEINNQHDQSTYDHLPHYLISMTSQYPSDMCTFGLNFNTTTGPQYIGPSISSLPLTSLVSTYQSDNDQFEFYNQNPQLKERLQSSICGISTYYSIDDDMKNQFHTLVLTSHGDLFDYCAHLTSSSSSNTSPSHDVVSESNQVKKNQNIITNWLTELSYKSENNDILSKSLQQYTNNHSGNLNLCNIMSSEQQEITHDLNDTSIQTNSPINDDDDDDDQSTSNHIDYFTLKQHLHQSELFINNYDSTSKYLLNDLQSIWNYTQNDDVEKFKYCDESSLSEYNSLFINHLTENRLQEERIHQKKLIHMNALDQLFEERLIKLKQLYFTTDNNCAQSVNNVDNSNDNSNHHKRWPCVLTPTIPDHSIPSSFTQSEYYTVEEF